MKLRLRLALRVEGSFWNAYIAEMGTLEGAVFLGSCSMAAAQNPEIKAGFMALMTRSFEVVSNLPVSHWNPPVLAPENERGGTA